MRVLWTHTFPGNIKNAGVFMYQIIAPLARLGVEVIPVYVGDIRKNPVRMFKVFRHLRAQAKTCDVLHAQYGSMCALVTAFLPGKKTVSLRGSDLCPVSVGTWRAYVHSFLSRTMTAFALPFFDYIIVMSQDMKNRLPKKYKTADISVIPDGIDLEKFRVISKTEARAKLSLTAQGPYVLFTAVLHHDPNKRTGLAMDAIDVARKTFPGLQVLMPKNVDHDLMPYYVSAADVLINTSAHEGWPNCVKEALACNVPFVATDVSDLKLIASRQPSCRVCDADPQMLGNALVEVLQSNEPHDLRAEMRPMAMEACAETLKGVYEALAAARMG